MFSNWLTQRQSFFKVPRTKASEQMKKKKKKRRSYKKNPPTIYRRLALSNEIPKLRHWLAARNVGSRDLEPIKRLILFRIQSLNSILEKFFLFSRELVYVRINISSTTWYGYTDENQEKRLFVNETTFLFWYHALWKLGTSNCCIFEMKPATGMETCTKIYFLFIFNPV